MDFIEIYLLLLLLFMGTVGIGSAITNYLEKKPNTNRFRKWWSNNIIDLDNRYN